MEPCQFSNNIRPAIWHVPTRTHAVPLSCILVSLNHTHPIAVSCARLWNCRLYVQVVLILHLSSTPIVIVWDGSPGSHGSAGRLLRQVLYPELLPGDRDTGYSQVAQWNFRRHFMIRDPIWTALDRRGSKHLNRPCGKVSRFCR